MAMRGGIHPISVVFFRDAHSVVGSLLTLLVLHKAGAAQNVVSDFSAVPCSRRYSIYQHILTAFDIG